MRYILIALVLTGCMSIEDRRSLMIENAKKNCTEMGFTPGTPEHSNCQLELIKAALGSRTVAVQAPTQPQSKPTRCVPVGSGVNCY